jgi:hypothetical protein
VTNYRLDWANCDHEASASAIVKGLSSRSTPGFLIHTSGTGILTYADVARGSYGTPSTKVYNDWDGVSEVTSLPDEAWHRKVDKIVLAAGDNVKTAIVCPPTIYGPGRGPGNTYSDQWYFVSPKCACNVIPISLTLIDGQGHDGAQIWLPNR